MKPLTHRLGPKRLTVSPVPADLADRQAYRTSCPGRWRRTSSATICPARVQHHYARGPYGAFRRPSKTRCPRATPTAHHRPAETRDPSVQKDRRAHTMATHRRMHMNQTVFSDTPHERGALGKPTVLLDSLGIIPACAGSTAPPGCRTFGRGDHPRMRGEYSFAAWAASFAAGSSPHARGAPLWGSLRAGSRGIIPACAGSTCTARRCSRCRGDHPRMRGEHRASVRSEVSAEGSSPHARGALDAPGLDLPEVGIIPACAGSTNAHQERRRDDVQKEELEGYI